MASAIKRIAKICAIYLCAPTVGSNIIEASQRAYNGAYSTPEKGWVSKKGPNNLVIVTPGIDTWASDYGLKIPFPYSTILHSKAKNASGLVAVITKSVKQNGTLDELVINAHGTAGIFSPDEENAIFIPLFLNRLISEQNKSKKPIARRIVFLSCAVFTDLSRVEVDYYRYAAKKLNAEIVGATNEVVNGFGIPNTITSGRYAAFLPNGRVVRDKLDVPYDPANLKGDLETRKDGLSDSWFSVAQQEYNLDAKTGELERPKNSLKPKNLVRRVNPS